MRPDLAKQIHGVGDAGKDLLPVKPSWPSHAAAKSYHDLIVSPEAVIGPCGIDRCIMDCSIPFLVALIGSVEPCAHVLPLFWLP